MIAFAFASRARSLREENRPRISAMQSILPWTVSISFVWSGRGEGPGRIELEAGRKVECCIFCLFEMTVSEKDGRVEGVRDGWQRGSQGPDTRIWTQESHALSHHGFSRYALPLTIVRDSAGERERRWNSVDCSDSKYDNSTVSRSLTQQTPH